MACGRAFWPHHRSNLKDDYLYRSIVRAVIGAERSEEIESMGEAMTTSVAVVNTNISHWFLALCSH